jgi:hypothetical protein
LVSRQRRHHHRGGGFDLCAETRKRKRTIGEPAPALYVATAPKVRCAVRQIDPTNGSLT